MARKLAPDFFFSLAWDIWLYHRPLFFIRKFFTWHERLQSMTKDWDTGRNLSNHAFTITGKMNAQHACMIGFFFEWAWFCFFSNDATSNIMPGSHLRNLLRILSILIMQNYVCMALMVKLMHNYATYNANGNRTLVLQKGPKSRQYRNEWFSSNPVFEWFTKLDHWVCDKKIGFPISVFRIFS